MWEGGSAVQCRVGSGGTALLGVMGRSGQDDSACEEEEEDACAAIEGSAEEDPVEDCSDGEAPVLPPNPRTPPGSAGRFAQLLGVPHSGGKRAPWVPRPADIANDPVAGTTSDQALSHDRVAITGAGPTDLEIPAAADTILDDAGDTVPASHEALLEAAHLHDDGTMGISAQHCSLEPETLEYTQMGEPTIAEPFVAMNAGIPEAINVTASATTATCTGMWPAADPLAPAAQGESVETAPAVAAEGEASGDEGSDDEATGALGPLPDEPWMSCPDQERELWEHVRPRMLRREGAQLNQLRLPAAAVNRIMRLHPDLHIRSTEAAEVINYSTIILLQAVTRSALRRKSIGQKIQFEDIKEACVGKRELSFLQPVSCTLDASAHMLRTDNSSTAGGIADTDAHGAGNDGHRGAVAGKRAPVALGASQRMLSASLFQNNIAQEPIENAADIARESELDCAGELETEVHNEHATVESDEFTPMRRLFHGAGEERPHLKRPAPASTTKTSNKAQRHVIGGNKTAACATGVVPGIMGFFKSSTTT